MNQDSLTYRNIRVNALAIAAFLAVIACAAVAILMADINEYAKGIVTFLLGRYSGYIDNVYSYEFGSTRNGKEKDIIISDLSAASPLAPSVITAAVVEKAVANAVEVKPEKGTI